MGLWCFFFLLFWGATQGSPYEVKGDPGDIQMVKEELQDLREENKLLREKVEKIILENEGMKKDIHTLKTEKETAQSVTRPAFYVRKTGNMAGGSTETIIHYEEEVLNEGLWWNGLGGQFIAPYDGLYVFHLIVTSYSGHALAYILHEGANVATANARTTNSAEQSGAAIVILSLKALEQVHTTLAAEGRLLGSGYSSFSGFFLESTTNITSRMA